jgi:hypothetical protein
VFTRNIVVHRLNTAVFTRNIVVFRLNTAVFTPDIAVFSVNTAARRPARRRRAEARPHELSAGLVVSGCKI